jgi:hypothetical protein
LTVGPAGTDGGALLTVLFNAKGWLGISYYQQSKRTRLKVYIDMERYTFLILALNCLAALWNNKLNSGIL